MKILMLTPYLPYPDSSGGQIRTQNLLKHLKKNHDITLFSLIKDPTEKKYIPTLEKNFCKKVQVFQRSSKPFTIQNILKTGFSMQPFLIVRNFSSEAKKAIAAELESGDYDLIHVETFYAMPHIPDTNVPVVLVDQTIEYKVYQHYVNNAAPFLLRPLMYIDVIKLKYWERYYWRLADKVVAVSAQDQKEMLELEPKLDVGLVPNGVNLDFFKQKKSWNTKEPKILFIGNFNWLQNTEAAHLLIEKILPQVQKELPRAKVYIVGQHQPESLKKLSSKSVVIKDLSEDDTDSIQKAFYESDIFCTPLFGPGGTRLKNLAAMASGLPIVSSKVGMTGLGVKHGTHAYINDSPTKMASYIIKLIKQPQKAEALAKNARKYVEQNYDYKVITSKLSKIYKQVSKNEPA